MTVSSSDNDHNYTGTNTTATYSFDFRALSDDDVRVTYTTAAGVTSVLTKDTDYTVTNNNYDGGSITLTAGNLATGAKINIANSPGLTQETDLRNQGAYLAEVVEDALDKQMVIAQETRSRVDRSIRVKATDDVDGELTSDMAASKAVMTNSAGTGFILAAPGSVSLATPGTDTVTTDTILDGAVTNAKMDDMAANTIKANITGSAATPTDATREEILSWLASYGFPLWYIDGHSIANNSTDADHDIDFGAMTMMDATGSSVIATSALTKKLDAPFTAGDDQGMLDTGSIATNTVYALYAIATAGGTTDYLASTSFSSPTMPSGYTIKRRIGWVVTNGSGNIIAFYQSGHRYRMMATYNPVLDSTITDDTTETTGTIVPPSSDVGCFVHIDNGSGTAGDDMYAMVRHPDQINAVTDGIRIIPHTDATIRGITGYQTALADTSGQLEYYASEESGASVIAITVHTVQDVMILEGA